MKNSNLNLSNYTIIGINPIIAGGSTPGRKALQIVFAPSKPERNESGKIVINNARQGSRNFWEAYTGKDAQGIEKTYKVDPLFDQIMTNVKLPSNFVWETETNGKGEVVTPAPFRALLNNVEIKAEVATEYVKEYTIDDSQSDDSRRVTYTCVIVDGDASKEQVFANQGHPMVFGAELEEAMEIASEIASVNDKGRQQRKEERISSGVLKPRTSGNFSAKMHASLA